jgi:hypothetical protein
MPKMAIIAHDPNLILFETGLYQKSFLTLPASLASACFIRAIFQGKK